MTAAEYNARRRQLRTGPRWHADDAKRAELVAMHGGGPNKFGVFEKHEEATLARVGKAFAVARLANSPAGLWVASACTGGRDWGHSSSPSIWDMAHDTRHDAWLYAILESLCHFESASRLHRSDKDAAECRKIDLRLRAMLAG